MKNPTVWLDLAGVVLLATFAFILWPPLALLTVGVFALVASWSLSRNPPVRPVPVREVHPSTIPEDEQ